MRRTHLPDVTNESTTGRRPQLRIRWCPDCSRLPIFLAMALLSLSNFGFAAAVAHPEVGQKSEQQADRHSVNERDCGSVSPALPPMATIQPQSGLHQLVKVVIDPDSNTITLIGTERDIAIVRQTISRIDEHLESNLDRVTERVRLDFQMAETVADILRRTMELEGSGLERLQISPLHFPESLFLVGPKRSVESAKRLIKRIDSHPRFESDRTRNK